jgi:hypothetical protein
MVRRRGYAFGAWAQERFGQGRHAKRGRDTRPQTQRKESSSFLNKGTKKLLSVAGGPVIRMCAGTLAQRTKFFGFFISELSFPPP